jgi:molybdenum cofactor biosynthesis enzyme MoaA
MVKAFRPEWKMKPRESKDLVFCHNDLSTHNVIVDPETLKVRSSSIGNMRASSPRSLRACFFAALDHQLHWEGEANDEKQLLDTMYENEATKT